MTGPADLVGALVQLDIREREHRPPLDTVAGSHIRCAESLAAVVMEHYSERLPWACHRCGFGPPISGAGSSMPGSARRRSARVVPHR